MRPIDLGIRPIPGTPDGRVPSGLLAVALSLGAHGLAVMLGLLAAALFRPGFDRFPEMMMVTLVVEEASKPEVEPEAPVVAPVPAPVHEAAPEERKPDPPKPRKADRPKLAPRKREAVPPAAPQAAAMAVPESSVVAATEEAVLKEEAGAEALPSLPASFASAGAPAAAGRDSLRAYAADLWNRISRRKPGNVRERGAVTVAFALASDGNLRSVRVATSSGIELLDQVAVETVREAAPFPLPPPGAAAGQLEFTVPFEFR